MVGVGPAKGTVGATVTHLPPGRAPRSDLEVIGLLIYGVLPADDGEVER